jgi:hypothetical protein
MAVPVLRAASYCARGNHAIREVSCGRKRPGKIPCFQLCWSHCPAATIAGQFLRAGWIPPLAWILSSCHLIEISNPLACAIPSLKNKGWKDQDVLYTSALIISYRLSCCLGRLFSSTRLEWGGANTRIRHRDTQRSRSSPASIARASFMYDAVYPSPTLRSTRRTSSWRRPVQHTALVDRGPSLCASTMTGFVEYL